MPKRQAFNVIISNVPGPREPLYWNGAKLDAIYPASIVLDGQALNITMTSYMDKLEVGLTGCRKTLPKMQTLLTHLEQEIQRFEQLIQVTQPVQAEIINVPVTEKVKSQSVKKVSLPKESAEIELPKKQVSVKNDMEENATLNKTEIEQTKPI